MTTMEFLNSIKPDNRFVSETAQSYFDQSLYLAEGIQVAYNETFQAIGLDELAMVMEAEGELSTFVASKETLVKDKKTVISKIADFFKNAWAYIKAFFNKIIATIKAYFGKYKANYVKFLDEAYKFFKDDYNGKEISFGKVYANLSLSDIYDDYKTIMDIYKDGVEEGYKILESNMDREDIKDKFVGFEFSKSKLLEIYKINKGSFSIKEAIKKNKFEDSKLVEVTNVTIKNQKTFDSIKGNAFKDKEWLNMIKKQYNETKKFIDNLMKKAKDLTNKNVGNVKMFMTSCRTFIFALSQLTGAINDVTKEFCGKVNNVAKRIIVKFLQLSGKNPKEILGESTEEKEPENYEGELVSDKDVSDDMLKEAVDLAFDWI